MIYDFESPFSEAGSNMNSADSPLSVGLLKNSNVISFEDISGNFKN